MSAVRSIIINDELSQVPFTLEAAGLPERPILTHTCPSCTSTSVLSPADGRDVAAWLIGECVDDGKPSICASVSVDGYLCVVGVGQMHPVHIDGKGTCWTNTQARPA